MDLSAAQLLSFYHCLHDMYHYLVSKKHVNPFRHTSHCISGSSPFSKNHNFGLMDSASLFIDYTDIYAYILQVLKFFEYIIIYGGGIIIIHTPVKKLDSYNKYKLILYGPLFA